MMPKKAIFYHLKNIFIANVPTNSLQFPAVDGETVNLLRFALRDIKQATDNLNPNKVYGFDKINKKMLPNVTVKNNSLCFKCHYTP